MFLVAATKHSREEAQATWGERHSGKNSWSVSGFLAFFDQKAEIGQEAELSSKH